MPAYFVLGSGPTVTVRDGRWRWRLAFAIAGGVAGLLLNTLPDRSIAGFFPGRALSLPIALVLGPWWGALAAAVACVPSAFSPVGAGGFVLEALVLGHLVRRGVTPLIAGVGYWLVATVGFALFAALRAPQGASQGVLWAVALQQPLNGMLIIGLADLLVSMPIARRLRELEAAPRPRHLRTQFFNALLVVATLPILTLYAVSTRLLAERQEHEAAMRLREAASAIGREVDDYIQWHVSAAESLAEAFAGEVERHGGSGAAVLETYSRRYPSFITLFVADSAGRVVHMYPVTQSAGATGRAR